MGVGDRVGSSFLMMGGWNDGREGGRKLSADAMLHVVPLCLVVETKNK